MTFLLIINYNDFKNTKRLIKNVFEYKTIDKIIVVDNKSTDDSYKNLKKMKNDKIDIILSDNNLGYSYAINLGIKHIESITDEANIFISNSDIIIKSEKDLEILINSFDENIGVIGPVIEEHGELNRGWKVPTPMQDALMNLVLIHNVIRKKKIFYNDEHYKTDKSIVEAVSGCFFLVKLSDMKKINYFDDAVFLYYEENILTKKLESINKTGLINNQVKVIHDHAASIDSNIKRIKKFKILKESQYYFQTKYNKANIFSKFMLKLCKNISLVIYHIAGFIKGGK